MLEKILKERILTLKNLPIFLFICALIGIMVIRSKVVSIPEARKQQASAEAVEITKIIDGINIPSEGMIYYFDFGTENSTIAEGCTQVTGTTKYEEMKYGWLSKVGSRDRKSYYEQPEKDLIYGEETGIFCVDLDNGTYKIDLVVGDPDYAREIKRVSINDTVISENISTKKREFEIVSGEIVITEGKLTLNIDKTESESHWSVTSLLIAKIN